MKLNHSTLSIYKSFYLNFKSANSHMKVVIIVIRPKIIFFCLFFCCFNLK